MNDYRPLPNLASSTLIIRLKFTENPNAEKDIAGSETPPNVKDPDSAGIPIIPIAVGVVALLVIAAVVAIIMWKRKSKKPTPKKGGLLTE